MERSPKKTDKFIIGILFVPLLFTSIILHTCSGGVISLLPYRSLKQFEGKVIDSDTKEPIKQAVVAAVYCMETYTIAGSNCIDIDGQEVLTDENGEFKVPRKKRWFVLYRGYPQGAIIILKPGYGMFPDHKRSVAVGENKSWPPPKKYIVYEIPKLEKSEDRKRNEPYIGDVKHKLYVLSQYLDQQRIEAGLNPYNIKNYWIVKGLIGPQEKTILEARLDRGIFTKKRGRSAARLQIPSETDRAYKADRRHFISSRSSLKTFIYSIRFESNLEQEELIKEINKKNLIYSLEEDRTVTFFEQSKKDIYKIVTKINKKPRVFFLNKTYADKFVELLHENQIPYLLRTKPNALGYDIIWDLKYSSKVEKLKLELFNKIIKHNQ